MPVVKRVSIIIPVYNRLNYLRDAITSALRQTHPGVDVIVVDDGSPLDPAPVVRPFGDRVIFVRKANGGLASARNYGMDRAAGEYLLFLDDDDFLEPTAVADLVAALAAHPGAVWAAGQFDYVDTDGRPLTRPQRQRYSSGDVYRKMILYNLMGAPSVVLASATWVRELGRFDEAPCYHMAEDYDLWLSLARVSPLAVTSCKVSNYRVHGNQFTQKNCETHLRAMLAVLHKQWRSARLGHDDEFREAIARVHLDRGDILYLVGDHVAARAEWRRAAQGGVLRGQALAWRCAKSRAPAAVLRLLRSGRVRLRGWGRKSPRMHLG